MFFPKLRKRAKWIFALLAFVFALGFVGFGVGAGGSGIGDFLSQIIHPNGGSSGPSVQDALDKLKKNPKDASAQLELAKAYEGHGKTDQAIAAYQGYVKLKPANSDALRSLAGLYAAKASAKRNEAIAAYQDSQLANPGQTFEDQTTPFGQALGSSPLNSPLASNATQRLTQAEIALQQAYRDETGVLQKLTKLQPADAGLFLELGQAAQLGQDTKTAIGAYRRFLQLAPDDPNAREVRKIVKQLSATPAAP
jgi:tetratricopeptide (TPR) repeat protein